MIARTESAGLLYGAPVIARGETVTGVARTIAAILFRHSGGARWALALLASLGLLVLAVAVQGHWSPARIAGATQSASAVSAMVWASYDFWVGIACGSLLITSILSLAVAEWRCAVMRIAEILAVAAACGALGLSALRPGWLAMIEPDASALWLTLTSADPRAILVSDATGLTVFLAVGCALLMVGLLPDLATLRDLERQSPDTDDVPSSSLRLKVYRWLASAWEGSASQWHRWNALTRAIALLGVIVATAILAGASVRLAASVTRAGSDSLLPVTVVVGSVFSAAGLISVFVVCVRKVYRLEALVTERHLDILARMLLVLGLLSLYCHLTTLAALVLYGDEPARTIQHAALGGGPAAASWILVLCGLLPVQLFWWAPARRSGQAIALVGLLVVFGMIADRIGLALIQHGPMDETSRQAALTHGLAAFATGLGIVSLMIVVALRVVPILSITEMRQLALLHNASPITQSRDDAIAAKVPLAAPASRSGEAIGGAVPNALASRLRSVVRPFPGAARGARIGAEFAEDAAVAAAIRTLTDRARPLRLAAFGPARMPETAEALRLTDGGIRDGALAGALIGGVGFFALSQWDIAMTPSELGGRGTLAWPFLILPSLAFAAMAGTLAAALAFFGVVRRGEAALDRSGRVWTDRDRFMLLAEPVDADADSGWIERRLADEPDPALRPLATHRLPRAELAGSRP